MSTILDLLGQLMEIGSKMGTDNPEFEEKFTALERKYHSSRSRHRSIETRNQVNHQSYDRQYESEAWLELALH
jgi:hypothetical protein